jgi:hypothetical protein
VPKCIPLTILGFVIGAFAAALIVGALTTPTSQHRDIGISSPIITATPTKQEDDPTWDCFEDGNRVCGDPDKTYAMDGWAQWDIQNGGRYLHVDPSREYRVDYIGIAKFTPKLACNEIALPSLSYWYVFRATYLDGTAACP